MDSINSPYHRYYDRLYAAKNYREETESILNVVRDLTGVSPRRVLDVGCGTGSHAMQFALAGCQVVGLDLDAGSIDVARSKCASLKNHAPCFMHMNVADLADSGFDLSVSLFNVINYIDNDDTLKLFLDAIQTRLADNGVFTFDCWNGLAALLDPPRVKETRLDSHGEHIVVRTTPDVDLMNQAVSVANHVTVSGPNGISDDFHYNYTSTLWTPRQLRDQLRDVGFSDVRVCRWMQANEPASEKDWKISFVCRKDVRRDAS